MDGGFWNGTCAWNRSEINNTLSNCSRCMEEARGRIRPHADADVDPDVLPPKKKKHRRQARYKRIHG